MTGRVREAGLAVVAMVAWLAPALADAAVGDHFIGLTVTARAQFLDIGPQDTLRNDTLSEEADVVGATLIAAMTPAGAPVGWLTLPAASVRLQSPPPGVYWVLMVVGHTTAHTAPASDWTQVTVTPACTGVPGAPTLQSTVTGTTVALRWTGGAGCNYDRFSLEIGATPGGTEFGSSLMSGVNATFSGVPPGTYYLRLRAGNPFGWGPASLEVPVNIPGASCNGPRNALSGLAANVTGNAVTLTWNPPPASGPPATFYQVLVKDRFSPDSSNPIVTSSFIVPASVRSLSGIVPSGGYRVQVLAGNACRVSLPLGIDLFFNVP